MEDSNWFESLVDRIRAWWAGLFVDRVRQQFLDCLDSDALDALLELLLRLMSMRFLIDPDFRRNIEGYEVSYLFRSKDSSILTSAIFRRGRMKVRTGGIDNPDIEVVFKDAKALKEFLFARTDEERDLIAAILDNGVSYGGNGNYLSKLAFMARHLMLELEPAS